MMGLPSGIAVRLCDDLELCENLSGLVLAFWTTAGDLLCPESLVSLTCSLGCEVCADSSDSIPLENVLDDFSW